MTRKQIIGWALVVLAFVLTAIVARFANRFWLEVLAVPIMALVGLGLLWGLNE
jgi:hypothetical protein